MNIHDDGFDRPQKLLFTLDVLGVYMKLAKREGYGQAIQIARDHS
jgi:hypothetical protein